MPRAVGLRSGRHRRKVGGRGGCFASRSRRGGTGQGLRQLRTQRIAGGAIVWRGVTAWRGVTGRCGGVARRSVCLCRQLTLCHRRTRQGCSQRSQVPAATCPPGSSRRLTQDLHQLGQIFHLSSPRKYEPRETRRGAGCPQPAKGQLHTSPRPAQTVGQRPGIITKAVRRDKSNSGLKACAPVTVCGVSAAFLRPLSPRSPSPLR
jgi:hypothetical protein